MLSLKSFGLGTTLIGSTLAAVSFAAMPAQAIALKGSIALTGASSIVDSGSGLYPASSTIQFGNVNISQSALDFIDVTQPPSITINDLVLSQVAGDSYSTPGQTPWINFGNQEINNVTASLTFNLDPATFTRIAFPSVGGGTSVFQFSNPQITGTFVFNGQTIGQGFVSASSSFGSSGYQVTLETVPEPFTMLGAGAALGFGAFFKRQSARKQGKDNNKE